MSNLKKNFGLKLQELRQQAGLTQEELAVQVGLSVESISNMERGVFGPKFDNLEKISYSLGVEVKELFDFS